jgi:hypothetical protein
MVETKNAALVFLTIFLLRFRECMKNEYGIFIKEYA